jgi:hypothetical protein
MESARNRAEVLAVREFSTTQQELFATLAAIDEDDEVFPEEHGALT